MFQPAPTHWWDHPKDIVTGIVNADPDQLVSPKSAGAIQETTMVQNGGFPQPMPSSYEQLAPPPLPIDHPEPAHRSSTSNSPQPQPYQQPRSAQPPLSLRGPTGFFETVDRYVNQEISAAAPAATNSYQGLHANINNGWNDDLVPSITSPMAPSPQINRPLQAPGAVRPMMLANTPSSFPSSTSSAGTQSLPSLAAVPLSNNNVMPNELDNKNNINTQSTVHPLAGVGRAFRSTPLTLPSAQFAAAAQPAPPPTSFSPSQPTLPPPTSFPPTLPTLPPPTSFPPSQPTLPPPTSFPPTLPTLPPPTSFPPASVPQRAPLVQSFSSSTSSVSSPIPAQLTQPQQLPQQPPTSVAFSSLPAYVPQVSTPASQQQAPLSFAPQQAGPDMNATTFTSSSAASNAWGNTGPQAAPLVHAMASMSLGGPGQMPMSFPMGPIGGGGSAQASQLPPQSGLAGMAAPMGQAAGGYGMPMGMGRAAAPSADVGLPPPMPASNYWAQKAAENANTQQRAQARGASLLTLDYSDVNPENMDFAYSTRYSHHAAKYKELGHAGQR